MQQAIASRWLKTGLRNGEAAGAQFLVVGGRHAMAASALVRVRPAQQRLADRDILQAAGADRKLAHFARPRCLELGVGIEAALVAFELTHRITTKLGGFGGP